MLTFVQMLHPNPNYNPNHNHNPNHDPQLLKNTIQLLIFEPKTQLAMTQQFIYSFSNPKPNTKPWVNSILSLCLTKVIFKHRDACI